MRAATAVVLEITRMGLANKPLGTSDAEVRAKLKAKMYVPDPQMLVPSVAPTPPSVTKM